MAPPRRWCAPGNRYYTPGEGEWECRTRVLIVLVGLRSLSGRSQWTKKSPGGVSCRSLPALTLKATRNRGGNWASLRSPCGLHRSLPVEGRRSFSWKPRTPSGRCASWSLSLPRRRLLSTLGLEGKCTTSSVAISHSCRAQQEASSFSLGERHRAKGNREQGRTRGQASRFPKAGPIKQSERVKPQEKGTN